MIIDENISITIGDDVPLDKEVIPLPIEIKEDIENNYESYPYRTPDEIYKAPVFRISDD